MSILLRIWALVNCSEGLQHIVEFPQYGGVAKLADAPDLGSGGAIRAGSIPVTPTTSIFMDGFHIPYTNFELPWFKFVNWLPANQSFTGQKLCYFHSRCESCRLLISAMTWCNV